MRKLEKIKRLRAKIYRNGEKILYLIHVNAKHNRMIVKLNQKKRKYNRVKK